MRADMGQTPRRFGLFFVLLCLLLSILFFEATSWSTGGHPTFPTDDSYIYFQYAKQLVSGHPFEYNTGDAPTTGMTSFLYWILLSFGYFIGFRGELLFYFAFFMGFLGLAVSAWLVYKIMESLLGRAAGFAAALLFCINGQIVWGYLSGLEIPLFTTILLLSLFCFLKDLDRNTFFGTMAACGLLAISRPEGLVLSCSLALLLLLAGQLKRLKEGARGSWKGRLWVLLPFVMSILYLVMNKAVTGHLSTSSASSKSMWLTPDVFKNIYAGTQFILDSLKGIFGGSYASDAIIGFTGRSPVAYFAPLALFFFLFGSFVGSAKELRARQISGFTVLLTVFIIGLGFVAFTSASGFQHHRYLIPFYPVFILLVVAGIFSFSSALGQKLGEHALRSGIVAFFVAVSLVALLHVLVKYAFEAEMVWNSTVHPAEWVESRLEDDDVLGLVDAGALAYFGGKKTVDFLGLTSADFYGRWKIGWGAVVEEISHMRKDERPSHVAIMSTFAEGTEGIEVLYVLFGEKVYEELPVYAKGQTIYRTDYTALDQGALRISEPESWILVDSLDVGYYPDEIRCGYRTLFERPGVRFTVGVHTASYGEGEEIADGGRMITGGERFTISTLPGKALRIVTRSASTFRTYRYSPVTDGYVSSTMLSFTPLDIYVNGLGLKGAGLETRGDDTWHETVLEIPSRFIVSNRTTVELIGSYNSFHYWFFQE